MDVVEELGKRGAHILEATYRGIEAGPRPPSPDVRRALSAVFGSPVPDLDAEIEATEPVQLSGLINALTAQTEAINRLADAIGMGTQLPDRVVQTLESRLVRRGLLPAESPTVESTTHQGVADTVQQQPTKRASTE